MPHEFEYSFTPILPVMPDMPNKLSIPAFQRQRGESTTACRSRAQPLAEGSVEFPIVHPLRPRFVCCEELLVRIGFAVRNALPSGIGLRLEILTELPLVFVDPAQAERALLNLAGNSCDAMPEGGVVTIEACARMAEPEESQGTGWMIDLSFIDNGADMDAAALKRAVEPFYSTKSNRRGLGLAMVNDFFQGMSGALSISSTQGVGTIVTLRLPCEEPSNTENDEISS